MPQESQIAHRNIRETNLAYKSNLNPTSTDPYLTTGSQDVMTNIVGYSERRLGFANFPEPVPSTFNNLQRLFTWDRFDGSFYYMACDINSSGFAQVYKLQVGVDNSFVSIFTDTSSTPFDFIVSNNTVYFSNGNVAKKWDPANGVTNWGIAMTPTGSTTGPNGVGTGSDVSYPNGGQAWANPGNITANDGSFATVTLTQGSSVTVGPNPPGAAADILGPGQSWSNVNNILVQDGSPATTVGDLSGSTLTSHELQASSFGFSIPNTATIAGILVEIKRQRPFTTNTTVKDNDVTLLKAGVAVGSNKGSNANWPGSFTFASYGGSSDLWGTTWTPTDINAAGFGVQMSAAMTSLDNINVPEADVDFIRITVYYTPAAGAAYSDYLQGTNTSLSIGTTNTVLGILVEVKGLQTVANSNTTMTAQLLKGGNLVGTAKSMNLGLSNAFVSFGSSSDLWGASFTANDINGTSFGVSLQAVSNTAGSVTWSVDYVRITVTSFGGPNVTLTAGSVVATTGFQYVFCYGNSNSGHISSPCPPSNVVKPTGGSSGLMNIPLTASTDAQVNQIHLYRSTDSVASGTVAGIYYELPSSPYPNTTQTVTDGNADTALVVASIAPSFNFNDRPNGGSGFRGMVYFSGRFWGFANNYVYFSGLEETIAGVPEESFTSGPAGNFWKFDETVTGLGVAGTGTSQTLLIFCPGRIYGITGNSLDTFRRFTISTRRGCRNYLTVVSQGGMVAWLDSAQQVWATDGNSMQELSTDIRPDLAALSPTGASFTFHTAGKFNWLVCAFPNQLFVFDMDMEQWMPPWNVTNKYVFSGETSAGVYELLLSSGPKALKLSTTAHNDNGSTYTPIWNTANFAVIPDYGKRFSYQSMGMYDEPTRTGYPVLLEVNTNGVSLGDVLYCFDDDPTNTATAYSSIFANLQLPTTAYLRGQGTSIVQNIFPTTQTNARWVGVKIKGQKADDGLRVYSFCMAYKNFGGR